MLTVLDPAPTATKRERVLLALSMTSLAIATALITWAERPAAQASSRDLDDRITVAAPRATVTAPDLGDDTVRTAGDTAEPVAAAPDGELASALAEGAPARCLPLIEAAVVGGDVHALPALENADLRKDGYVAAAVIRAVADLGAEASPALRDGAARTLARWLDEERSRDTIDAFGNVSLLTEALGQSRSAAAVPALTRMLDDGEQPLFVETLAVQSLGALGSPDARDAVLRFAAKVASATSEEGLDAELRQEARAATSDTLARLPSAPR
jgi:hypothetical protein